MKKQRSNIVPIKEFITFSGQHFPSIGMQKTVTIKNYKTISNPYPNRKKKTFTKFKYVYEQN